MRFIGSLFFGFIFVVVFIVYFALRAIVNLPTDTEALVGSLQEADLHGQMVSVLEASVEQQIKEAPGDKKYNAVILSKVKPIVSAVLPEDWFYETLTSAHSGFVTFLEDGEDTTKIDLRERKKQLKEKLVTVGEETLALCEKHGGGEACESVKQATAAFTLLEGQINAAIDRVPDETNFTALASRSGKDVSELTESQELKDLREGMSMVKKAKWAGLGILVFLLLIIGLVNFTGPPRALIAMGVVLVLSGGIYLGALSALAPMGEEWIVENVERETGSEAGVFDKVARDTGRDVLVNVYRSGYKGSNTAVIITMVIGVAMAGGGIALAAKT